MNFENRGFGMVWAVWAVFYNVLNTPIQVICPIVGQTCLLPLLIANVIKNNIISPVMYIIVCLPMTE